MNFAIVIFACLNLLELSYSRFCLVKSSTLFLRKCGLCLSLPVSVSMFMCLRLVFAR